jgi:flagellar export protein FliJ
MLMLQKKVKRLSPVIEVRQARFDEENNRLIEVRERKLRTVAAMRAKQREYMEGVQRLNDERGTSNRLMLEALESGLDNVKSHWMKLYQAVVELEREEKTQLDLMSQAHRDLEAIKTLQNKYRNEASRELDRREQKNLDEHSLRKFLRTE